MFKRAQCLLFFAQDQEESTGALKKSTRRSTPAAGGVKAHALLATAFTDQHPEVVTLFQRNDIHIVHNGDEKRVIKENTELEALEIFLDESPNAKIDPFSVSTDHPDKSFVTLMFCRTVVKVAQIKWRATDMRPAVDAKNCRVFGRLLLSRFNLDNKLGEGSLLHVATNREQEVLIRVALDNGAEIDGRTENGATPLHLAVFRGALFLVKLLIEKGASIDSKDNAGQTPFHLACQKSNLKIVEFLLKNNPNIHARTNEGCTPLHEAMFRGSKDAAAIVRLLIKAGAVVDVKDARGRTPLHLTCFLETQEILLQNGADANSLDNDGQAPIHKAAKAGTVASIEILLDYGARVSTGPTSVLELVYDRWSSFDANVFRFLLEFCFVGPQFSWEIKNQLILDKITDDGFWSYSREKSKECATILSQHLVKMTVLHELPYEIADVQKIWLDKNMTLDNFRGKCKAELAWMKALKLGGTDLTMRDFLARNEYQVAKLLRNQAVAKAVDPDILVKRFPHYGAILAHHVGKGKHRKWLQREGIRSLNLLCPQFKQVPDEIKETILGHLSILDIVNVRRTGFLAQKSVTRS